MFNRRRRDLTDEEHLSGYDLDSPLSQRWKPEYSVPRNSLESRITDKEVGSGERPRHVPHPLSFGRNRRDMDTFAGGIRQSNEESEDEEEFSDPKLWIETVSE